MNCPLCKNEDVIYIDTINKNELIFLYKKTFNVDVFYLITDVTHISTFAIHHMQFCWLLLTVSFLKQSDLDYV